MVTTKQYLTKQDRERLEEAEELGIDHLRKAIGEENFNYYQADMPLNIELDVIKENQSVENTREVQSFQLSPMNNSKIQDTHKPVKPEPKKALMGRRRSSDCKMNSQYCDKTQGICYCFVHEKRESPAKYAS